MFTGIGVLDLSGCSITDTGVEKIAAGLTSNNSLKELDLSENKITSIGAAHIFRSLEHNISLDKLLLSCNSQLALGNNEMFTSSLRQMLTTNKSLSVLDLSHCGITDEIMKYIGAGLTKNKSLTALNIDSEYLTKDGIKCLYQSLRQNEAITILRQFSINLQVLNNPFGLVISSKCDTHAVLKLFKSLEQETTVDKLVVHRSTINQQRPRHYNFRFYEQDDESLGRAMKKMLIVSQTLRILDLQNCRCSDVLTGHIATALAKNCFIKQLVLKVTSVGAACLFKSLEHNTSLEELEVFREIPAKDHGEALGCAVQKMLTVNQTLKVFNLRSCYLNDVTTYHFLTGLAKNSSVITHSGATRIFKSLEQNTSLKELHLSHDSDSWNSRSARDTCEDSEAVGFAVAVEEMLTVNQTLRVFNLQNYHLSDVITSHLATGLTKNSSVKRVVVTVNNIGAAHMFKSLKHNTNLEELVLYHSLTKDNGESLGCAVQEMLSVNQTLKIFDLLNYPLNDMIIGHMSAGLAKNMSVSCLILKVTCIGAAHIFKSLEHNTSLEELELSLIVSTKDDDEALGNAIQKILTVNQTLRLLNLQNCYLNDVITNCMSTGLANNSSVKRLNLKVTSIGTAHIFESLKHNTSLEELRLTSEDVLHSPQGDCDALGFVMEEMLTINQTLKNLNLQSYHLSDVTIGHIATGLTKNCSVKQLILKCNGITSVGAAHIFKSLENNTTLEELDLSSNDFSHCQFSTEEDEVLGCAVEGMLKINNTLKMLNLQDCCLSNVITDHIVIGLHSNDFCRCKYGSTSHSHATNYISESYMQFEELVGYDDIYELLSI